MEVWMGWATLGIIAGFAGGYFLGTITEFLGHHINRLLVGKYYWED